MFIKVPIIILQKIFSFTKFQAETFFFAYTITFVCWWDGNSDLIFEPITTQHCTAISTAELFC
jgi:hypothetical protein